MGKSVKWIYQIIALSFLIMGIPQTTFAHGVDIKYNSTISYQIVATFDNGSPMDGAQVNIFAPGEPSKPWESGITDDKGVYQFNPDSSIQGTWEIQVRKAGHGGMTTFEVNSTGIQSKSTNANLIQKSVMIGSVIWGCIGTALYFRRKK